MKAARIRRRNFLGTVINEMPDPDRKLTVRDRLIIVGEKGDLERLLIATNTRAFGAYGAGERSS
jgi:hypothetical protein